MKKFSDFNITPTNKAFDGKKIAFAEIFNIPIIIRDYKIEESKYQGKNKSDKRLQLSIIIDNENCITFTGSDNLMETISQIPKEDFPFQTTIRKREKRFEFT